MSLFDRAALLFAVTLDRWWHRGLAVRLLALLDASITIPDPSAAMMKRVSQRRAFMAAHKAPGDDVNHGLLGYYYAGTVAT